MITKKDFSEQFEDLKKILKLYKIVFFQPELITNYTYAHTKRNKFKNKYIYLFIISISIIISIFKFFIPGEGLNELLNVLLSTFIILCINAPTIFTLTILDDKIKKEYKKIYFLTILSVSILISLVQTVSLFFYLTFENYFFYYLSIIIGFIRFYWLCYKLPIKRNKNEKKKYRVIRLIKTIFVFLVTNILISSISFWGILREKNQEETVFINDPILTEVFNECDYVLKKTQEINETLQIVCKYSYSDLYENPETRKYIIQTINLAQINNQEIIDKYNKIKYKKTKKLYTGLVNCINNLNKINEYCNQIHDYNFKETKNFLDSIENEHKKYKTILDKNQEELNVIEQKYKEIEPRLNELIEKVNKQEVKESITKISNEIFDNNTQKESKNIEKISYVETLKLFINSCDIRFNALQIMENEDYSYLDEETKIELSKVINELKTLCMKEKELFSEMLETQQFLDNSEIELKKKTIDIQIFNNNIEIINNILKLINSSISYMNDENNYITDIQKFIDFRLWTFYL